MLIGGLASGAFGNTRMSNDADVRSKFSQRPRARLLSLGRRTVMRRVRFHIGDRILEDVLQGGNPVHDAANEALCERNRERIEAACRRAFADRPGERVDLQPIDFSE
jgi:hypothetical protein